MRVIEILQDHIYSTLFLYILIEEIGVPLPIPGDALLLYLGIQSNQGEANLWLVLLVTCLGTLIATTILFLFARAVGRPFFLKHEKYLRFVHITSRDLDTLEHYMGQHGTWVLIIARLTPGLRILGTVAAGLLDVSYRKFISATMAGTVIWTLIYFGIGSYLGERFESQIDSLFSNKLVMLTIFVAGLALWVILFKLVSPTLRRGRPSKSVDELSR